MVAPRGRCRRRTGRAGREGTRPEAAATPAAAERRPSTAGRAPAQAAASHTGAAGSASRQLVVFLLIVVWAVASWFAFSSGVSDANKRLDPNAKAALNPQSGLLLSHSTTILMLGTDNNAKLASRAGDMHSDSILLLRTDPSHHRLYYLSIPRDLQVAIPGSSTQKINAAFQIGGAALAIKTIRQFTGLDINHVMVVNFGDFKDLIDRLGGITVNVPKPIRSNRFDCPFPTQARCDRWQGWRFHKGPQHMNGERALIYSRIRENLLDPCGDGRHPRRAAAGRARRDRGEVHVDRDADRRAVRRQLARQAADHRPHARASSSSSAG